MLTAMLQWLLAIDNFDSEPEVTGLDLYTEHTGMGYATPDSLDPHGSEGSR